MNKKTCIFFFNFFRMKKRNIILIFLSHLGHKKLYIEVTKNYMVMIKKIFYLSFFVTFFLLIKNPKNIFSFFSRVKKKNPSCRVQTDSVKSSEKNPVVVGQ